jgi:hypothetical protein
MAPESDKKIKRVKQTRMHIVTRELVGFGGCLRQTSMRRASLEEHQRGEKSSAG